MSTESQGKGGKLDRNLAISLAATALQLKQEFNSVAELADMAGLSRQRLHRLAKREIKRRAAVTTAEGSLEVGKQGVSK